jgi:hypothetical protein
MLTENPIEKEQEMLNEQELTAISELIGNLTFKPGQSMQMVAYEQLARKIHRMIKALNAKSPEDTKDVKKPKKNKN